MVYRGICYRAYGLSGNLLSGFWFIGKRAFGLLVHRRICYRAFDLSGFCNRANGHRAFSYRPYVVLPGWGLGMGGPPAAPSNFGTCWNIKTSDIPLESSSQQDFNGVYGMSKYCTIAFKMAAKLADAAV